MRSRAVPVVLALVVPLAGCPAFLSDDWTVGGDASASDGGALDGQDGAIAEGGAADGTGLADVAHDARDAGSGGSDGAAEASPDATDAAQDASGTTVDLTAAGTPSTNAAGVSESGAVIQLGVSATLLAVEFDCALASGDTIRVHVWDASSQASVAVGLDVAGLGGAARWYRSALTSPLSALAGPPQKYVVAARFSNPSTQCVFVKGALAGPLGGLSVNGWVTGDAMDGGDGGNGGDVFPNTSTQTALSMRLDEP